MFDQWTDDQLVVLVIALDNQLKSTVASETFTAEVKAIRHELTMERLTRMMLAERAAERAARG